ncbi:MAG: hypothetical protein JST30_10425 [Armatimonadetes bacterium]|nr:hypothetical protein [Armatimonadota bacterium]
MAKGGKKGGKKLLLLVLPVIVLGGGFVGLAVTGIVKVPGLTPKKPQVKPMYGETAKKDEAPKKEPEKPKAKPDDKPAVAAAPPPKIDAEAGAKKVGQLWNGVPTPQLVEIVKSYKDDELAKVLVLMDPEKVAELLAAVDAKRSAKLSKELQKVASIVKDEKES